MCLYVYYKKSSESKRDEIFKKITQTLRHMAHLDSSIDMIGVLLLGPINDRSIVHAVRGHGLPLVDDWSCLKSTVHFC